MEIKNMGYEDIEKRNKEILEKLDGDLTLEEVNALNEEVEALELRKKEISESVEKRNALLEKVKTAPEVKVIEERKADEKMEKVLDHKSMEYRNAFIKTLMGKELSEVEERAYTHTVANTGAVVPEELQNKIYSNMEEAHPILRDVQVLKTGTPIKIAKHTAIVAGDAAQKGEGVANDDEQNTFVEVTLAGKKFTKHIDISYELEAMAIPAFETYLVNEIGARLGAAMAANIVAQVTSDLAVANKFDAEVPGTLDLKDVLKGLGKLKGAGRVYVYVNNETFYNDVATLDGDAGRVSFIPNHQEAIAGQLLGKGIKEEDAVPAGQVLILDPQQFIWNEVRGITLERDRDIKKGVVTIAGHAIAEGSMTNDKAGALLTVGDAA